MLNVKLKKVCYLIVLFGALVLLPTGIGVAGVSDPVTIAVHNPTGDTEVTHLFASRLPNLEGMTVCELANRQWEAERMFPVLREALQKKYPTLKIIDYKNMPHFTERTTPQELVKIASIVKTAGCQAAIVGNAG